ncbi:MAG: ATP-binding protein [Methanoregula sp.]|nr:ATP-binding protein [Methanoregula sp.]
MAEGSLLLTIQSDINEIPRVSSVLERMMRDHDFTEEDILDTQLAVEEAVTNIITHGYEQAQGEIVVLCRAGPGIIEIQLEDRAVPFNPLSIPEPDLAGDIEERRIGGLGIFLVRQVMDEVEYRFEDGKNILRLTKRKTV